MSGVDSAADLYAASYGENGRFIEVKKYDIEKGAKVKKIEDIAFTKTDNIDSIKFMLFYSNTIRPLCNFLKLE